MSNLKNNYNTLSEALNDLANKGYTEDFNLFDQGNSSDAIQSLMDGKFTIVEFYRFDGMTNVSDEAVLYVIETDNGVKGSLVDAYGVDANPEIAKIIKQKEVEMSA